MAREFKGAVLSVHGVPRSGTTWLGEIFNSHPDVAYRYQPLFAHRFRGRLGVHPSAPDIAAFLDDLYRVEDDEFILQVKQRRAGAQAVFDKQLPPTCLVMKMVRFHYLIEYFLRYDEAFRAIGLVRNPCAVINSWLKTPREFKPEWDPLAEWRLAPSKNQGKAEEYFGFEKWKEAATLFLDLERRYPERFRLMRYETLVDRTAETVQEMFNFAGLDMHRQTRDFIDASQGKEVEHPDSVFRKKDVRDRWTRELNPVVRAGIERDLRGTDLEAFLLS